MQPFLNLIPATNLVGNQFQSHKRDIIEPRRVGQDRFSLTNKSFRRNGTTTHRRQPLILATPASQWEDLKPEMALCWMVRATGYTGSKGAKA